MGGGGDCLISRVGNRWAIIIVPTSLPIELEPSALNEGELPASAADLGVYTTLVEVMTNSEEFLTLR